MIPTGYRWCAPLGIWIIVGCADPVPRWNQHDLPPSVQVAADARAVAFGGVRSLPAPPVRFGALIEPDLQHATPVLAPITGTVLITSIAGPVGRHALLAIVQGDAADSAGSVVRAKHDGTWAPRRATTQFALRGDTIGFLQANTYWRAVGEIDIAAGLSVHPGDPAQVSFGDDPSSTREGRVEQVRSRGDYAREIAVHFEARAVCAACVYPVTVLVTPSGATDSVLAVPAAAVVHLAGADAVFVPLGEDRFQVTWVWGMVLVDSLVMVRGDLAAGDRVVVHGMAPLVAAARDSVARIIGVGRRQQRN